MRKAEGKEVGSGVCNPSPELRLCISKFQVVFMLGYYGEISRGLYQLVATSLPPIIHFNRCLICNDTKEIY